MKSLFVFSILLVYVIFLIGVLALNNIEQIENLCVPGYPNMGKYRVAADMHGPLSTTCYTHSKIVPVTPPIYLAVRIWDYASAGLRCTNNNLSGSYEWDIQVPRKRDIVAIRYFEGNHTDGNSVENEWDLFMGSPDIGQCKAKTTIRSSGFSSTSKIPW